MLLPSAKSAALAVSCLYFVQSEEHLQSVHAVRPSSRGGKSPNSGLNGRRLSRGHRQQQQQQQHKTRSSFFTGTRSLFGDRQSDGLLFASSSASGIAADDDGFASGNSLPCGAGLSQPSIRSSSSNNNNNNSIRAYQHNHIAPIRGGKVGMQRQKPTPRSTPSSSSSTTPSSTTSKPKNKPSAHGVSQPLGMSSARFQTKPATSWRRISKPSVSPPTAAAASKPRPHVSASSTALSSGSQTSLASPTLSSSVPPSTTVARTGHGIPYNPNKGTLLRNIRENLRSAKNVLPFDWAVASVFFCTSCAITLPTTLVPMIAQDAVQQAALASASNAAAGAAPLSLTAFVTHAASIAIIGGGSGKWFNGVMTQTLHPKTIANWYLLIVSGFLLTLSVIPTNPTIAGLTIAGLEFVASALWAVCSIVVAQKYAAPGQKKTPENSRKFSRAITLLALSATSGQVFSKMVLGTFLLPFFHWRTVARCSTLLPLIGWALARVYFPSAPTKTAPPSNIMRRQPRGDAASKPAQESLIVTIRKVLGKPLFWVVGLAHIAGYLSRTSDRIMGPFLHEFTGLSHAICAGLTTALTFGFVHGLSQSSAFLKLPTVEQKTRRLRNSYLRSITAVLGLAACGLQSVRSAVLPHPYMVAAAVVACSATFTSNLAFAFFQIPNLISSSSTFAEQKGMTLCFLDGLGFILTAPFWAISSHIITSVGWTAMWSILAGIIGIGGLLMIPAATPMFREQQQQQK